MSSKNTQLTFSQKNPHWIDFNYNPWGKWIDDCAIRAISGATGLDYRVVCKILNVKWKAGYGLIRKCGINLNDIHHKFKKYFDRVEDYGFAMKYVPDEMQGSIEDQQIKDIEAQLGIDYDTSGDTLNDFCDIYAGQGRFLIGLIGNPNAKSKIPAIKDPHMGHLVYANLRPNARKQGFIDVFDSGEMCVDCYMRVAHTEPIDSPLHYKFNTATRKFIT